MEERGCVAGLGGALALVAFLLIYPELEQEYRSGSVFFGVALAAAAGACFLALATSWVHRSGGGDEGRARRRRRSAALFVPCERCGHLLGPESASHCAACGAAHHPECFERRGCGRAGCAEEHPPAARQDARAPRLITPTQPPDPGQRCPYCRDDLATDLALSACPECGTVHHRDCFLELGRCASLSCGHEHAEPERPPRFTPS